jgi:hypothetical protein
MVAIADIVASVFITQGNGYKTACTGTAWSLAVNTWQT